jgi:hypothetical protein
MVRRLEGLFFIASLDDLADKRRQAEEWFHEVAGRLDEKLLG